MSRPVAVRPPAAPRDRNDDISVTAMYTSAVWHWAGFDGAQLLHMKQSGRVFVVTNFVLALTNLFRRGHHTLRYSLVQRHVIIDTVLVDSGVKRVMEIAAGLSRRGVSLSRNPGIQYIELDLPHMVRSKRELLSRTPEGRAILQRPNLVLHEGDATEDDLSGLIPGPEPTVIISEGLMMYLTAREQRTLWAEVAQLVDDRPGSSYIFDLVPRAETADQGQSRVGGMLEFAMKLFTRGKGFEDDDRTRHDLVDDLRASGFRTVECLEPASFGKVDDLPHMDKDTEVLLFLCR